MRLTRRRFLSSLGLGASAPLLLPLATQLSGSAWAEATPSAKNIVFVSMSAGLPDLQLGWPSRLPVGQKDNKQNIEFTDWSYHEALAPLAPWRNQTAIIRNLPTGVSPSPLPRADSTP